MRLGTKKWYRLMLCEYVLGSTDRIRLLIKVSNSVPIPSNMLYPANWIYLQAG